MTCTWRVSLRPARGVLRPGSSWKSADVRVAGVWASPGALTAGGGARGGEGEEGMGGCGREQSRALSTQTACWEVGTDGGRTEHRRVGAVPGFASVPRTQGGHRARAGCTSSGTDFCCVFRSLYTFIFTGKILKRYL